MTIYEVSLTFLFDDKENPEIKNKDDAISLAIDEINEIPISDFYFEVKIAKDVPNRDSLINKNSPSYFG